MFATTFTQPTPKANVLIDGNENAKLSDFGSATLVGVYNFRDIESRKGNIKSCAPELHLSAEEPSFPCDVYSFAMLCIEVREALTQNVCELMMDTRSF